MDTRDAIREEVAAGTKNSIRPELVHEFVANAHGDLARVSQLLQEEPKLVNASWDWGAGDWETALGAAAHMGRRDIAELLLDKGARTDLFAAAMLGQVEIVRAILQTHPEMRHAPGPHGIPLLEHARVGGPEAATVLKHLEENG